MLGVIGGGRRVAKIFEQMERALYGESVVLLTNERPIGLEVVLKIVWHTWLPAHLVVECPNVSIVLDFVRAAVAAILDEECPTAVLALRGVDGRVAMEAEWLVMPADYKRDLRQAANDAPWAALASPALAASRGRALPRRA